MLYETFNTKSTHARLTVQVVNAVNTTKKVMKYIVLLHYVYVTTTIGICLSNLGK